MTIKPSAPQPVRLLVRADAAPAGRPRAALRTRFQAQLAPAADAIPPAPATPAADVPEAEQQAAADTLPAAAADVVVPAAPTLSRRIARACARDERANLRMARLAAIIGDFVNTPAIIDSGCWELQIALDPALLPATRLRLSLSSCRLSLRFESSDRDARCVILDNSEELRHRLQALLPAHIDIDIVCW